MNTMGKLLDAYWQLLNGSLSYNSTDVPVYKIDAPEDAPLNYVLIYGESETNTGNKRSFAFDTVVIVDIVTQNENVIDNRAVDSIDGQISSLVLSSPAVNNLSTQTGMQILNVEVATTAYIPERDGVNVFYRKVLRYNQRILQTA